MTPRSDSGGALRQIFLGDVQGCADELGELLDRADAEFGDAWHLWVVGDLVNRGPDNLGPLRRVRERVDAGHAHYILGNHEIHLIATALGLRAISPWDTIADVLDAPDVDDWIAQVKRVNRLDFDILVGGHGPMGVKRDVGEGIAYLQELRAEVLKGLKAGNTVDELKRDIKMEKYRDWAAYDQWRELNVQGMARHLQESGAVQ